LWDRAKKLRSLLDDWLRRRRPERAQQPPLQEPRPLGDGQRDASVVPVDWKPGDLIVDRYEVLGELGAGGMGKVLKVHDRHWSIDLAVKSPRPDAFQTMDQKENFLRECHVWMGLGLHQHIVTCHYVRVIAGIPRVFADCIDGGSLRDWIDHGYLYEGSNAKALERILDIAIQFSQGLEYAHEKGLIHQDIKPANVMLTNDGLAKLTDFGLANAKAILEQNPNPTSHGTILASYGGMTPAYCSPEQALNSIRRQEGYPLEKLQKLTRRTDIYSWAVSVLEMFTGGVVWQAGIVAGQALESYIKRGPHEEDLPEIPRELAGVLHLCLKQNPSDRPRSMTEVTEALQSVWQTVTGREYHRQTPTPVAEMANVLNNKALSYLELDAKRYGEHAEILWGQALSLDPHHPESTYNLGLREWDTARITPNELIRRLEEVRTTHEDEWRDEYLLGLAHIANGNRDSAIELLEEALGDSGDGTEVISALKEARQLQPACIQVFEGHTAPVQAIAVSQDERWAISGSSDGTIRLWEMDTGNCVRIFRGHTGSVNSVCFSKDGQYILSASADYSEGKDNTLRLWHVDADACVQVIRGHTCWIESAQMTSDMKYALSGSFQYDGNDNTFRVWDIASEECIQCHSEEHLHALHLGADDCTVAYSCEDPDDYRCHFVSVYHFPSKHWIATMRGHTGEINSLCISRDCEWVLSGSDDKSVRIWRIPRYSIPHVSVEAHLVLDGHRERVTAVALSEDTRIAVSGDAQGELHIWNATTGQCMRTLRPHRDYINSVGIFGSGRYVLTGGRDGKLCKLRLDVFESGELLENFSVYSPSMSGDAAGKDEAHFSQLLESANAALLKGDIRLAILKASEGRKIQGYGRTKEALDLWHQVRQRTHVTGFRGGWQARTIRGHQDSVLSVYLSDDGCHALSGSSDGFCRLWNMDTGTILFESTIDKPISQVIVKPNSPVDSVSISADQTAFSFSCNGRIQFHDFQTGRIKAVLGGNSPFVSCHGVSLVICANYNARIRLRDVHEARTLRVYDGHEARLNAIALSPDETWFASGSGGIFSNERDWSVRVWQLATGRCIRVLEGHKGPVHSLAISKKGDFIASAGIDETCRIWDQATGECVQKLDCGTSISAICLTADGDWAVLAGLDGGIQIWYLQSAECVRVLVGHSGPVNSISMTPNGRWVLSGGDDKTMRLWELDWEIAPVEVSDWNEGARPFLQHFLTLQTPFANPLPNWSGLDVEMSTSLTRDPKMLEWVSQQQKKLILPALTRKGQPSWAEKDFAGLLDTLAYANYGWLRPEGVRKELQTMADKWTGPPPLPGMD